MRFIYIIPLSLLLQGCFSSSMMQTAKPLEKGQTQWSVGASGYMLSGDWGAAPDIMYRRGINSKSDFGVGYSMGLYGHFRGDYKHTLLVSQNQKRYLSSGIGLDFYYPEPFSGDDYFVGFTIPLYFSMNHGKKVVPYFAQRFTPALNGLRIIGVYGNENPPLERIRHSHSLFYSGAAGIRFGERRVKWFLEASYSVKHEHYYYHYAYENDVGETEWYLDKGKDIDLGFQLSLGMMIGNKQ